MTRSCARSGWAEGGGSLTAFDVGQLQLSGRCVRPDRSLIITDERVIADPLRTAVDGPWSFSHLVRELAGADVGALFFLPGVVLASTIGFQVIPSRVLQRAALVFSCVALLVPLALEWAGILPASYAFSAEGMTVLTHGTSFSPGPTVAFLTLANVAVVVGPALFVARIGRALSRAEHRLHVHAWHLRQLLPEPPTENR